MSKPGTQTSNPSRGGCENIVKHEEKSKMRSKRWPRHVEKHVQNVDFYDLHVLFRVFRDLAGQGSSREGGRGEGKPYPIDVLTDVRPRVDGFLY